MSRLLFCSVMFSMAAAAAEAQEPVVPERLSLDDALRIANDRNPLLAAARNEVDMAEAQRLDATLRPNPAFSFEAANYPLGGSAPQPSFLNNQELTFRLDQEIETAGRRRLRMQVAEAGIAAAQALVDDERRRVELDVRRAYFGVVLAKADLEVSRAALSEIDKVIELNRARYEQGEISGAEVRRIQVERLKFVDDTFAAQLALRNASSTLLALLNAPDLGVELDVTETLASTDPAVAIPAPGGGTAMTQLDSRSLRAQALADRPDLRAARTAVERAETETRLQRALRTPNVTVGGGYVRDFGTNALVVGVTVPLPLTNRNQGGIARAEAARRRAEHLATATASLVRLDVQRAFNEAEVSRQRVGYIEREYLTPSRESRDIVLAAYRLGTADLIDFLDAQRAYRDTLRTYNRALYDRRLALFQLTAATGGSNVQR